MEIHRLHSANDPAFQALLSIYTASLPASERKTPAALTAMLARPEYLFLTASSNNTTTAFAIAINFQRCPEASLLEYLAVDSTQRSRGHGQQLFNTLTQRPELANRTLIVEVDVPNDPTTLRRKSFYRKLGCREIAGLTYLMPQVAATPPPSMNLLLYKPDLPAALPKSHLQHWLECIYTEVYAQPHTDLRIAQMIAALSDPIPLGATG